MVFFNSSIALRTVLVPAATVVAVKPQKDECQDQILVKPSQLPIYVPEPERKQVKEQIQAQISGEIGVIEGAVKSTREAIQKVTGEISAYERVGLDYLEQSKENVSWVVDYLRQEDNTLPRAGAIGIGALAGFIMGLRGRFFKRTLYATAGGLGMAAVCYPKEAAQYSQVGLTETRKYVTIAYNFVLGVDKDDPIKELPSLPKLPTSLSEAWDSVKSTASGLVSDAKPKPQTQEPKPEKK